MKRELNLTVRKIVDRVVHNDKGEEETSSIMLESVNGVSVSITDEEGAWNGLNPDDAVKIVITNPQRKLSVDEEDEDE